MNKRNKDHFRWCIFLSQKKPKQFVSSEGVTTLGIDTGCGCEIELFHIEAGLKGTLEIGRLACPQSQVRIPRHGDRFGFKSAPPIWATLTLLQFSPESQDMYKTLVTCLCLGKDKSCMRILILETKLLTELLAKVSTKPHFFHFPLSMPPSAEKNQQNHCPAGFGALRRPTQD